MKSLIPFVSWKAVWSCMQIANATTWESMNRFHIWQLRIKDRPSPFAKSSSSWATGAHAQLRCETSFPVSLSQKINNSPQPRYVTRTGLRPAVCWRHLELCRGAETTSARDESIVFGHQQAAEHYDTSQCGCVYLCLCAPLQSAIKSDAVLNERFRTTIRTHVFIKQSNRRRVSDAPRRPLVLCLSGH